jgi:hypothetical protein
MIDTHTHRDHRREAAMATNQSNGRGYDFDRIVDESPLWIRALEEALRPRSLVIFAVIGAVMSLWWL